MSGQRVLVTGSTGYLGGHVCSALAAVEGLQVVAACRDRTRLPAGFAGEVRVGDLTDPGYRRAVVEGIDVVCHAGTWAAMWRHRDDERRLFFDPGLDLAQQAAAAGVGRFVLAGTVVVGPSGPDQSAPGLGRAPFWPHLDLLIELDARLRQLAGPAFEVLTLRLGHFVGPGNRLGLLPALLPRLRTGLVPWLSRGRARLPLVTGEDLGQAFVRSCLADLDRAYDSFAICGPEFPTAREVITAVATSAGCRRPWFSVPYPAATALAAVLETLDPVLPGRAPFLTRSIVHLARDWWCPDERAATVLGYVPSGDWRAAAASAVAEIVGADQGWPELKQRI